MNPTKIVEILGERNSIANLSKRENINSILAVSFSK